jgi:phosphoesterase RecJ-like protein
MWNKIADFIDSYDTFLLTTHINPEGDAIGSEIALKAFLESRGKRVTIVNSSPTPKNCEWLDPAGEIHIYPDQYKPEMMEAADAVIITDVNGWIHLGSFADAVKASDKPRACIDHHQGVEDQFADVMVSDTAAASAGLLVYECIKALGGEITPIIADAVYASIITDTGTFRFTNTDERVFRTAAELLSCGADAFNIHRLVFGNRSWQAANLLGPVLNSLESAVDGKLAWIYMTNSMREEAGASYEDSDGMIDLVRAIRGVELCLFFKETDRGTVKISLRSNGRVDAYKIARKHGGGGHRMAAGMTLEGEMRSVIDTVIGDALAADELRE